MARQRIILDTDNPLRSLRDALGWTQEEAAAKLGVIRSQVGNAELRGEGVTVRKLREIARGYGRRLQIVAIDEVEEEAPDEK